MTYPGLHRLGGGDRALAARRPGHGRCRGPRDAWLRELLRRQPLDRSARLAAPTIRRSAAGATRSSPRPAEGRTCRGDYRRRPLVDALRGRGAADRRLEADDPAIRKALTFIQRCQNFAEGDRDADPRYDDGGFFFSPTDPVQNKAGSRAGTDARGVRRYHSYGIDDRRRAPGAAALRPPRRPPAGRGEPRMAGAALRGLLASRHLRAGRARSSATPRISTDAWSVAHAFRALGIAEIAHPRGRARLGRGPRARADPPPAPRRDLDQPLHGLKEDDPLVATSLAAGALGLCRLQRLTVPP